jgi:YNFM family putative membrane transporter
MHPALPDGPITRGTPAYRKLAIAMVAAGFSTFSLLYSVQPLLPEFADRFHLSAEAASLAVSVATGPMAITILIAGVMSDRIGRRPLMLVSLFAAGLFGLLAAAAPTWEALLLSRLLCGIALAGVPAVAMAYVSEEVDGPAIGAAMGLYVAGSALGGMIGRLGVALVAGWAGWRLGLVAMGMFSLVCAAAFWRLAPPSQRFEPRHHDLRSFLVGTRALLTDRALLLLYGEGFLLMGVFVTLYNYVSFRLIAPPYSLGHAAVGAIFLLYIVGSVSSAASGALAGRLGVRPVLTCAILVMLAGVGLTAPAPLALVVIGIGVATAGFFGAHTTASGWVGRRAFANRGQATALYLFFYYLGSSLLGSAGGVAWSHAGWPGIVAFTGALSLLALVSALRLARIPALHDPRQPSADATKVAGG